MIEVIILAGGFGTRLRSVVSNIPKPMALIGNKPFLAILMKRLAENGVNRVILSVGYLSQVIKEYFGIEFMDMQLIYSTETEPLGTGGAIKQALNYVEGKYVYVLNGDTFLDESLRNLEKYKILDHSIVLVGLKTKNSDRYGILKLDEQEEFVSEFKPRGNLGSKYINGGCYLIKKNIFENLQIKLEKKFSFEEDFLSKYTKDLKIKFHKSNGFFLDIGVPKDLERARVILRRMNVG